MPGTKEIRTARLLLRKHVKTDAGPLFERFGNDPAMFEYSDWNPYESLEMAKKTVDDLISSYDNARSYAWAIEQGDRLAGTIGAYDFDAEKNAIEVGMGIEKASWGNGFATEALTAVLHYLAEEEKIATIEAWCASDNIGSQRAMEKAGMVKVGAEPAALTVGDATFDKLWYEFRSEDAFCRSEPMEPMYNSVNT